MNIYLGQELSFSDNSAVAYDNGGDNYDEYDDDYSDDDTDNYAYDDQDIDLGKLKRYIHDL